MFIFSSLGGWHALEVGIISLLSIVLYRRFFHPLAKVPGPFLPAVTRLYAWYYNVPKEGKFYKEIERLHNIYGQSPAILPVPFPLRSFYIG